VRFIKKGQDHFEVEAEVFWYKEQLRNGFPTSGKEHDLEAMKHKGNCLKLKQAPCTVASPVPAVCKPRYIV